MVDNNSTEKRFAIGYWITSHRKQIKIAYTFFLGIIAVAMVVLTLYEFIIWVMNIGATNQLLEDLGANTITHEYVSRPNPIEPAKSKSIRRDAGKIDIVSYLVNTNEIWAAMDVEYEVLISGESVGIEHVSLAPLQEKYITKTQLPYTSEDLPSVQVKVLDTTWKKMRSTNSLPDPDWEFADADFGYINAFESNVSYKTKLSFTLKNNSIWGFRDARIVVLLVDDMQEIQAIGSLPLDSIASLETREVSFLWPLRLSSSLTPRIHINIDKLDENLIIRKLR